MLDVDSFAFVKFDKRVLLQPGVEFDLVRGGDDGTFAEDAFELCFGEVRDADCARFTGFLTFFHGFPGLNRVLVSY